MPDENNEKPVDPKVVDHSETIASLQKQIEELKASNKKEEPSLGDKVKAKTEEEDRSKQSSKALEDALKFSLKSEEFIKVNGALLPKDIPEIFKLAEKENYSGAIEKDQAIKAGIVQSFFSVQANADLLSSWQKATLDEYLKLTKTGKQEKAQSIYDSVFEPVFEMLKRSKKAEALNRGLNPGSDAETQYKQRLMSGSKKHYGLEK